MKRFFGFLSAFVVTFALLVPFSSASAQEVTYDKIVFLRENHGPGGNTWTQLIFRVEGFRIDGECYVNCKLAFTLDSSIGQNEDRSDIGVRPYASRMGGATVNSDLPFDRYNQVFIGSNTRSAASRAVFTALSRRERIAIAWIAANSQEFIQYALASEIEYQPARDLWQRRVKNFESRLLLNLGLDVVTAYATRFTRLVNNQQDLKRLIQPALSEMHLYTATIDGLNGPATKRAIRAFQQDNNRLQTGYVDAKELQMLRTYLEKKRGKTDKTTLSQTPNGRQPVL